MTTIASMPPLPANEDLGEIIKQVRKRASDALTTKENTSRSDYGKTLSELIVERGRSEQDLRRQIVLFRKYLLLYLIVFMTLESIALFTIVILASVGRLKITDPTLQILVGATIAQISAMLIVIVRSVYSDSLNKIIMSREPITIPR